MQERITKRAGRFVRLLAGRPPVVSTDARGPRDSEYVALRTDSLLTDPAVGPLAVANPLAPPPSPAAGPPAATSPLAAPANIAVPPAASPASASYSHVTERRVLRGRLSASAALLGMLLLCLVTCLVAAWRQADVLAGLGFCAGCVLAPVYARRAAQLRVAISAPVIFLVAEISAQSLVAPGSSGHGAVLSVIEGTLLALAYAAPWLFAGTAVCIVIAMFRGLPQCVRDLRTGPAMRSAGRAGLGVSADGALRDQRSQRSLGLLRLAVSGLAKLARKAEHHSLADRLDLFDIGETALGQPRQNACH
jgi:hypothetical protein